MPSQLPVLTDDPDPTIMPRVRGDCLPGGRNSARPCGWTCCRFALAAEGSPGLCALDVADAHPEGLTHDAVGKLIGGLTRERVRQIERAALAKVRKRAEHRPDLAGYRELATLPGEAKHQLRVPGRS